MLLETIDSYYKSNVYKPFYMAVGDEEYRELKSKLETRGDVDFVHLSDCCPNVDKIPDLDKLRETLRMADINCASNKIVLLGLGEYLALKGKNYARNVLEELISFNLGSAHAVFLLRGVSAEIKDMLKDPRYSMRQIAIGSETVSCLNFVFSSFELGLYETDGFRKALQLAEEGKNDRICVNTAISFPDSLYQIQVIRNPYEAICKKDRSFNIPKHIGSEANWESFLKDINQFGSIENVFKKRGFDSILDDFYKKVSGDSYENWVYYLFLMKHKEEMSNCYLRYVLDICNDFDDFKYKVLNAIIDISHTQNGFSQLYDDRKKLVSQYPDADVAVFVSNNRYDPKESAYKLTDNTLVEREEIIADISQHGIPDSLEKIYPALCLYLKKYHFHGDAISELLTDYFDTYKQQKLSNTLYPDFLDKVNDLAIERVYNRLRTRDEIVAGIDTQGSYLRWIDALGVEYLSFIVEKAQKRGLAVSVNIGRANLPTITGINKGFYELWPEDQKSKVEDLDDVKHTEKGGYKYSASSQYPIHLAKELDIISDVIDEAATDLGLRQYDRYILASDHGASRLAVLRKKEEKYETDTKGEHSGRCCKTFEDYDLPFATEENGYVILADYGRFKGSRAANVEVHGGASLEEVVVPIITLSLKDNSTVIQMVESTVKADYKTGITITLFVNKPITQNLFIDYKGKRYQGRSIDSNHYKVDIPDIKKAGTLPADVYLGEDLVAHINIKAVGKSASFNTDFDDLL